MVREVGREDVQRLVADGAQLIEVLPAREYEREHIAGAISIPLGRLAEEAGRLARARPVIVYCYDYQ